MQVWCDDCGGWNGLTHSHARRDGLWRRYVGAMLFSGLCMCVGYVALLSVAAVLAAIDLAAVRSYERWLLQPVPHVVRPRLALDGLVWIGDAPGTSTGANSAASARTQLGVPSVSTKYPRPAAQGAAASAQRRGR